MQCNNIFHMLPIDIVFDIIERIVKSIIELLTYTTGYGGRIMWESYALEDLSNVAAICRESSELWRAHVPMFCMAVMEIHMPERVWRQFGAPQVITPAPKRYDRKDGRGHVGENWLLYHARNIGRWNDHANTILEPPTQEEDQSQWRQWYERQSNLYLTPFSEEPPKEYCPRGPIERALVDVTSRTRELLITNPEASYLDVKKEILKLQEDTLNKLRIKIPEYEQPSISFGAEYIPGESSGGPNTWTHPWTSEQWPNVYDAQSRGISQMDLQMSQWRQDSGVLDVLTPVRVSTPPPHIIGGVHIHDQGTQLTPHIEEEGEDNDETQRRMIRGRGKHVAEAFNEFAVGVRRIEGTVGAWGGGRWRAGEEGVGEGFKDIDFT
ncbi:hypothetical protein Taro_054600 [Colocasia esculenta]|uniref:Aminotransferase-like plant mobile domain-containing protein n=1 Tax=Colocasia esculenta TaxID=4460 RepID=A0A843XNZ4_COLES|nr:hypothetical protein [Colocasia esculenta]